jgi:hypothetical protein
MVGIASIPGITGVGGRHGPDGGVSQDEQAIFQASCRHCRRAAAFRKNCGLPRMPSAVS